MNEKMGIAKAVTAAADMGDSNQWAYHLNDKSYGSLNITTQEQRQVINDQSTTTTLARIWRTTKPNTEDLRLIAEGHEYYWRNKA